MALSPSRKTAATGRSLSPLSIFMGLVVVAGIAIHFTMFFIFHSNCDSRLETEAIAFNIDKPSKIKEPKKHKTLDYSFETIPSRTWKIYEHPFPCYPPGKEERATLGLTTPAREGILFQRPTKVGSTTMTGIILRIAHNRAAVEMEKMKNTTNLWEKKKPYCKHRAMHAGSIELEYPQRNKEKSFLFSLVRDPTRRAISQYFHFHVTMTQTDPTDADFVKHVLSQRGSSSVLRSLTFDKRLAQAMSAEFEHFLKEYTQQHSNESTPLLTRPWVDLGVSETLNYTQIVQEILDNYDFIAVTERMDESLVAMKLMLGLSLEEILYAKISRSAGSFSNGPPKTRPCMYLIPSFVSRNMNDFFYTPGKNQQWLEYTRGDALLRTAASLSLDRTIDEVFGRERFNRELLEFQNAQAYARAICESEPELILSMCDDAGNSVVHDPNRTTTCYIWSEGCDHKCLNERVPNPIPKKVLDGTQKYGE